MVTFTKIPLNLIVSFVAGFLTHWLSGYTQNFISPLPAITTHFVMNGTGLHSWKFLRKNFPSSLSANNSGHALQATSSGGNDGHLRSEAWYRSENTNASFQQCDLGQIQLKGNIPVDVSSISLDDLYKGPLEFMHRGGWWAPDDCLPQRHVAIIIPFRQREHHLPILFRQLFPILKRRQYHFRIFVIEQADQATFNRAKLMNVGFREAQNYFPYPCFVFHDVDLLPEKDEIYYGCEISPAHVSVGVDKFRYKLFYLGLFGGIEMFTKADFEKINGFSNIFWLWGGEDDNLYNRVIRNGLQVHRQSVETARFTMIRHVDSKEKHLLNEKARGEFMKKVEQRIKEDGLNSLKYKILERIEHPLYTLVKVDLLKDQDTIIL